MIIVCNCRLSAQIYNNLLRMIIYYLIKCYSTVADHFDQYIPTQQKLTKQEL